MRNLDWIIVGVTAVSLASVWALLRLVTARGGEKSGDAAEITEAVLAQTAMVYGDESDTEPWDGVDRLGKAGHGDPGFGF